MNRFLHLLLVLIVTSLTSRPSHTLADDSAGATAIEGKRGSAEISATEEAADSESRFLNVVRQTVDVILENGRDTYGDQQSEMIISVLDRKNGKPIRSLPRPPQGVRHSDRVGTGGSNANLQQDLYRTMLHLSRLTADMQYEQSARASLQDFIRITQHPDTGFLAWGDRPLPRASSKADYYDVVTGTDTLILALLAVHEQFASKDPQIEISDLIR